MKWALYKIYLLYNIVVCISITCFGLYQQTKNLDFEAFMLIMYAGLIFGFLKNLWAWRIMNAYTKKDIVDATIKAPFYILWVINLAYTLALVYLTWDTFSERSFDRNEMHITILMLAFLAMSFTSAYTLILDIALVQKATKAQDLSEDLLSDHDNKAV